MPDHKKFRESLTTATISRVEPVVIDLMSDKISAQRKFDECLIEAIDEALTSLGAPVKNTVYFQLENNFNIPKKEIPNHIDKFSDIMHKIFGLGASRLEIKFMTNLYSKIKVNVELTEYECPLSRWIINDLSFPEYVCKARTNYCDQEEKREESCTIQFEVSALKINKGE